MTQDYIEALTSGYQWSSFLPGTLEITYTFDHTKTHFSLTGLATQAEDFNAAQKAATRAVLKHYEDIADIKFTEVSSSQLLTTADITFVSAETQNDSAGFAYYPSSWGSDVVIDNVYDGTASGSNANYYGIEPGQFGYRLLLHEIGHAMGLEHPHEGVALAEAIDSQNTTVMSYDDSSSSKVGGDIAKRVGPDAPQTLQIYDIAVMQSIYGANHNYNAGDNTYVFDGVTKVFTLWDGDGIDTYDASSMFGNVTLDLREGAEHVSKIGDENIWTAIGANIENATAGSGNDSLFGNSLANMLRGMSGNDRLEGFGGSDFINGNAGTDTVDGGMGADSLLGGRDNDRLFGSGGEDRVNGNLGDDVVFGDAGNDRVHGGKNDDIVYGGAGNDSVFGDLGNDTLYGNEGADVFVFASQNGADVIQDFTSGVDKIELRHDGVDASNILSLVSYVNSQAVINIDAQSVISLVGVVEGVIGESDFVFL